MIAGAPTFAAACRALHAAGWQSQISGNRISVNDAVYARYVDADGQPASAEPLWIVYGIEEQPAVRVVAARNSI